MYTCSDANAGFKGQKFTCNNCTCVRVRDQVWCAASEAGETGSAGYRGDSAGNSEDTERLVWFR